MELTSIKSIDISIVIPSNKPHGITKSYPYEIHGRRDTQDGVIGTRTTEGATSERSARFKKKNKPNQCVEPKYPSGKSRRPIRSGLRHLGTSNDAKVAS